MTDQQLAPQTRLVLDYLSTGRELTGMIAFMNLGVASLTSRIAELRKAGYEINDKHSHDHFGKRYKKYWMAETGRAVALRSAMQEDSV